MSAIPRPDWLPADVYPFTIRHLHLDGRDVGYVDEGDGPPLLLVHAGTWSFVFRDVITRLRDRFRCLAIDFPGYGLAPEVDADPTLAELAELVERFVAELDLRSTTLVAHDVGGPVSLAAAGRDPDRYAGLVLANTFAWTPDSLGLRTMLRVVGSRPMTAIGTATNLVPRLTAGRGGVGRHLGPDDRAAFLGPFRDRARRRRFHTTIRAVLAEPDVTAEAESALLGPLADRPVLSIYGERNDPFGFQARIDSMMADHRGLVIEAGNHFPMMDDPDRFAAELAAWHAERVATGATSR